MTATYPQRVVRWPAALLVWLAAAVAAVALVVAQYLRPAPLGNAYVLDTQHYVWYAMLSELFGLGLLSAPFIALTARRQRPPVARGLLGAQIALLTLSLLLSQLNHELQRFMGAQLSLDFIRTYLHIERTPEVIWQALADDRGGPYSALGLYAIAPLFATLAVRGSHSLRLPVERPVDRKTLVTALLFVVLGLAVPLGWLLGPGGGNRKLKLRSPLVLFYDSLRQRTSDPARYARLADDVRAAQRAWLAADDSGAYRFADPDYPLRRVRVGPPPPPPAVPPNVIVLSLETFRARDVGSFNPRVRPSPTPFLDSLARDPNSAIYPRYIANGIPTVAAFMSMHTSTLPHSERTVASAFTATTLDAFPLHARQRGYHTAFFTGSDPDWDNQRHWLNRWYHEVHFDPAFRERDRQVFAHALRRVLQLGRGGKPFVTTIASISNHTPFRSPEPALDITPGRTAVERLHNTMHYTDDVVAGFVAALRREPWFERTVLIITGDHGFDLGERGGPSIGHDNLRHESLWVPLIVHGRDPRLPRGVQARVASHIDLAPTIADLVGHVGAVSFTGHSLLAPATSDSFAVAVRNHNLAFETAELSAFLPAHGAPSVYAGGDALQEVERDAAEFPAMRQWTARARALSLVTDWALEHDRVAP
jgi:arylsulfatase A-like enzyme